MRRIKIIAFTILCVFCLALFSNSKANSDQSALIKIGVSGQNLFFQSILPKLFEQADLDYVSENIPFTRAIWGLSKGDLDVIGPYSMDALGKYALSTRLSLFNITRVETAIDHAPMFGLYTDQGLETDLIKNIHDKRIAIRRDTTLNLPVASNQIFHPKSLDQLVKLLLSNRVNIAIVSKKDLDLIRKTHGDKPLFSTPRPLLFQTQYLFVRSDKAWLKERLDQTLSDFTKTDYHQVRWEKYSQEKEWQD